MKGFTLIELLISISIFSVITTVAVFNHSEFNGSVLLTNLAYEIALSVRQAQFYGISVKQSSSSNFDSSYGIHIDTSTPASQTSYILFEDTPYGAQHVRDSNGTTDVDTQIFSIAKGNRISKICVDGGTSCSEATVVDITFTRPNPDAYITAGGVQGAYKSRADICVSSPQGIVRRVIVESTGQISVASDDATHPLCN